MRRTRKVQYINKRRYETKIDNGQKMSYKPLILLGITLSIFMLVQLLTLSIVGTKGAELAQIENETAQTEERIRQLKGEVSQAQSLDRIEKVATQKLGMIKVESVVYLGGNDTISSR